MHQASSKSPRKTTVVTIFQNYSRVVSILPGRWYVVSRSWWRTRTEWIHAEKTFLKSKMELTLQFSDKKVILQTRKRPGLADSKKESKWFEWKTHVCKMPIWTVDLPSPAPCKAVQYHVMSTGIACSGAMIVCRCFGEDFFCWRDMDETTYPCQMILIIYQMQTSSKARCNTQNS